MYNKNARSGYFIDISKWREYEDGLHWGTLSSAILYETSSKLLESIDPKSVIHEICMKVSEFLKCDMFFNYIFDEKENILLLNAFKGIPEETANAIKRLEVGQAVCGYVALEKCRAIVENIQDMDNPRAGLVRSFGVRAYVCHPLIYRDRLLGTLSFGTKSKDCFNEDEINMMCLVSNQVAVALNNMLKKRELEKQKKELEQTVRMKDEFLSLISHEFRTPLTVINSAIQIMELTCRGEFSIKTWGYINKIKQNCFRQLRLINNLLDITKSNSGYLKNNNVNINIVFLTRAIIDSVLPYCRQKGILLEFYSSIEERIIGIDEEKYERVMLNLLSNAMKFTASGKSIYVNVYEKEQDVCIEVRDEGIGIPEDKQALIFERFGQVNSSLTREAEGSGIGLSLVKILVDVMSGTIEVVSEEGVGSIFIIRFPAKKTKNIDKNNLKQFNENSFVESLHIEFSDIYFD